MRTADIRSRFLEYFSSRGHTVVPSHSLISPDPTLLLVNAGMVPFKPYFVGERTPPWQRATSVQKCVRTIDIEEVGQTSRHGSFFQMCGNFSFGDYFKEGAITHAWELLTTPQSDGGFGFDESKLWATIYLDDDEAHGIWRHTIGLPEERIQRLGKADNYWDMGVPGPCGPDSEIFVDRGPEYGREGGPAVDGERFLEVWNLVFMQYERGAAESGSGKEFKDYPILGELPQKNIDTGMGLERVAALLQGVDNLFEIDEVYPILDAAAQLSGRKYGHNHDDDVRLRVIADHVRTGLMLIGDGVRPSNEGRGYVLRRLLRRAVRAIRLLGYEGPAFTELFPVARDAMSPSYAELAADYDRIASYAYAEEEQFAATLRQGTTILDTAVRSAKETGRTQLAGAQAFTLHDTYGFPIDLTLEMAAEHGLSVDEGEFRRLMGEQRARAKADAAARGAGSGDVTVYRRLLDTNGESRFTGYEESMRESRVIGLVGSGGEVNGAGEGEEIEVILDVTPFYAEGGGQQPDWGVLTTGSGELEVYDVQSPMPGLIVHKARVRRGEVRPGEQIQAEIDLDRRRSISRSHTATHMVHKAIRNRLGETATQAGSLNAPGRLRFDFSTPGAVPASVVGEVEDEINAVLLEDREVHAFLTNIDEARRMGAMALFGEKYGDVVRVVEIMDYGRELCGGTHAARSGQLGVVKLLSEASIGSGVRRVEALVGLDAFRYLAREHVLVSQLAETFKAPADQLPDRVNGILERLRQAERELDKLKAASVLARAGELASGAHDVAGVALVSAVLPDGLSGGDLRGLALDVRGRLDQSRPGVVVLLSATDGKVAFVAAHNDAARGAGLAAGAVVGELAPLVGGRGGGRDDVAQGGGTEPGGMPEAVRRVEQFVGQRVTGTA